MAIAGGAFVTRTSGQLHAVLDALAAEHVRGGAQREELVLLERERVRLDAEIARRLAELDRSGEWAIDGARSTASWLVARTRCATRVAHHRVHVARQVEEMHLIKQSWRAGEITSDHAAAAAKVRAAAKADDQFAVFEPALRDLAVAGTPDDLARAGRQWRDALDDALGRDGSGDTVADEQHAQRAVHFSRSLDGMGVLDGTFDVEGAEFVETALERAYRLFHARNDPRSPAQQRADALVEICRAWCDHQDRGSNRPHFLGLVDERTVRGEAVGTCQTLSGYRLSPETARRLFCDAYLQPVVTGANGVPLALGRAERTFSADQYRAMVVRDAGCRFPGCDVGPQHCEAHHRDPWEAGGSTDLDNGILVCRGSGHHRAVHEGRVVIVGESAGRLDFYAKDGTWLGFSLPAKPAPSIPTQRGADAAAARAWARQVVREARGQPPPRAA